MMLYPGGGYCGEYWPAQGVVFRRTLSPVGARVGSRQTLLMVLLIILGSACF